MSRFYGGNQSWAHQRMSCNRLCNGRHICWLFDNDNSSHVIPSDRHSALGTNSSASSISVLAAALEPSGQPLLVQPSSEIQKVSSINTINALWLGLLGKWPRLYSNSCINQSCGVVIGHHQSAYVLPSSPYPSCDTPTCPGHPGTTAEPWRGTRDGGLS